MARVKCSSSGYYGFKLKDFEDKLVYDDLPYTLYSIPEIGSKGELFANIPKTNEEYVISNKGNIYKVVYNKHFDRREFTKVDIFIDSFVGSDKQGKGTIARYKYAYINRNGRSIKLWVGRTIGDLFVQKPRGILFKDWIGEEFLPIDQSKLRISYKDNEGTNVKSSNIEWVFRNDIAYKGVTIGNNTLPKYDNGGEKYVIYRVADGYVKAVVNTTRDGKDYLASRCVNGDIMTRMYKGRFETAVDIDGDIITCRKLSCLKGDTSKIAVIVYNNALTYLAQESKDREENTLF